MAKKLLKELPKKNFFFFFKNFKKYKKKIQKVKKIYCKKLQKVTVNDTTTLFLLFRIAFKYFPVRMKVCTNGSPRENSYKSWFEFDSKNKIKKKERSAQVVHT